jgi:hypothetical protein
MHAYSSMRARRVYVYVCVHVYVCSATQGGHNRGWHNRGCGTRAQHERAFLNVDIVAVTPSVVAEL